MPPLPIRWASGLKSSDFNWVYSVCYLSFGVFIKFGLLFDALGESLLISYNDELSLMKPGVGAFGVGVKKLLNFTDAPALPKLITSEVEFSGGLFALATAVLTLSNGMSSPEVREGINIFWLSYVLVSPPSTFVCSSPLDIPPFPGTRPFLDNSLVLFLADYGRIMARSLCRTLEDLWLPRALPLWPPLSARPGLNKSF